MGSKGSKLKKKNTQNNCFQLKNIEDLLITWSKYYNIKPKIVEEYYSLDSIAEFEGKVSIWNQNNLLTKLSLSLYCNV